MLKKFQNSLVGAGIGGGIALVLGLFAGTPFSLVLLRMVASAVVIGGLVFAIQWIFNSFLPPEDNVDNELPGGQFVENSEGDGEVGQTVNFSMEGDEGEMEGIYSSSSQRQAEFIPLVKEVVETRTPSVAEMESNSVTEGFGAEFSSDFAKGVAHLPDIGGYSNTFGAYQGSEREVLDSTPSQGTKKGQSGMLDPELIAKAISTKMKRDEN